MVVSLHSAAHLLLAQTELHSLHVLLHTVLQLSDEPEGTSWVHSVYRGQGSTRGQSHQLAAVRTGFDPLKTARGG